MDNKIVYLRPDAVKPQVSLVGGGGAGHEPSFSGFVGRGMLSGAVAGTIFASPSAEQIRRCILQRVEKSKGVLVVVMNYTGDVLNFGMGVEKAKSAGIDVEMVIMRDDVGVGKAKSGKVGRRGIAGTTLVAKIAGALAATGASLKEVKKVADVVANNTVSIGSSLAHVHVPGRAPDGKDDLAIDQTEVGMGIHNEVGSERVTTELPGTVKTMLTYMLDKSDSDRAYLDINKGDKFILLINNLGGVSPLEMAGITAEVSSQLESDWQLKPVRTLAGTFTTSLNGLGFSISILKLADSGVKQSLLELFDADTEATGWTATVKSSTWDNPPTQVSTATDDANVVGKPSNISIDPKKTTEILKFALNRLIQAEPEVTRMDTLVGDGDCGIGLKRGAEGVIASLDTNETDAARYLDKICATVENVMDGTSGAIYAIFLNALAGGLREQGNGGSNANTAVWAKAAQIARESMLVYTPAKPGDRTLVDALVPFIDELNASGDVDRAALAADSGTTKTRGMKANLGRTVYVGGTGYEEVPDPGAYGLAAFFKGLAEALKF